MRNPKRSRWRDRVVVMNAGRVEQISDPFELYTRPKSGFVARFIGRNTIITGQIKNVSKKHAGVQTSVGLLAGVPGFDVSIAQNGTSAMLGNSIRICRFA